VHASVDQRRSPFLSTGNAIIGQPVDNFDALTVIFSEDELRQIALDRSPLSRSYSVGVAHSLTPNLQVNADYNHTTIDATPDSGGVLGMPGSQYDYLSTNLVASSLFKEGDVMIFGARYSDSGTAQVISLTLDGRVPFGRSLWINPRLRVDQRERLNAPDKEYIYTPGVRVQYRWGRKVRLEFEAGRQFTQSDTELVNFGRDSYFINLGYQAFF
jgi:hypothetical protein